MIGSLHQHQYCEKLKKVVEFAGAKLSNDELTTIWTMQVCGFELSGINLWSRAGVVRASCRQWDMKLPYIGCYGTSTRYKTWLSLSLVGFDRNDFQILCLSSSIVWTCARCPKSVFGMWLNILSSIHKGYCYTDEKQNTITCNNNKCKKKKQ